MPWLLVRAMLIWSLLANPRQPSIAYTLRIDPNHLDVVDVAIRLDHAPAVVRLAMKRHPEYDAKYWRYLDSARVDGSANDRRARIVREDTTLWRVTLPGGHGIVHYQIHVRPPTSAVRRAWQPFVRQTGALINSPDFFLYLPDFANASVTLDLDVPRPWQIATSLQSLPTPGRVRFAAPNAAAFLDAPILLGELHDWAFSDRGTTFHVVYWPLPGAAPFDTTAFVDELRRLTRATVDIFGRAPSPVFYFLIQDGAGDALEHRASVTIGVPSAELARDPRSSLTEIAHEFFHTWNLVAIHPDDYGALSYLPPHRTTGLWWGEGVTMYYADALPRRAMIADSVPSRLDHLARLLRSYYAAAWSTRVSPERASLAMGDSPIANPDATGGYYLQGELLGQAIDALVRDSTHDAHGIDDVMRALFLHGAGGFTSATLETLTDSVCACRLDQLFATQVRGSALIDVRPVLARLGWRLVVDTVVATDSTGAPLPDLRLTVDFTGGDAPLRLVASNPASAWTIAGIRSGDELTALNGAPIATYADLQRALHTLRLGDTATIDIRRASTAILIRVPVAVYTRPRVRFMDAPDATAAQRARRLTWLAGW
jgi:predicted metalloprotease with PDZ domain